MVCCSSPFQNRFSNFLTAHCPELEEVYLPCPSLLRINNNFTGYSYSLHPVSMVAKVSYKKSQMDLTTVRFG